MALSVASFIIDKLKDPVLKEAYLLYGVSGKVNSVTRQFEYIKVALEAVEKRETEDTAAKPWVDQVREVAFRIEDAIDIYHLEVKDDGTTTNGGCRWFNFIKWIHKYRMKLVARHNLGVELSDREATLKEIKENREMFKLNVSGPDGSSNLKEKLVRNRCQLEYLDETQIVGLDDDKKAIVRKLVDAEVQDVISVVGTGGLGKTTLARKVFNSMEVKENFNVRIWLSVSREFDTVNILKKMLGKIREVRQEEKDQDEEYFIEKIRSSLKEQRFFIVLDDVWEQQFWLDIRQVCPPDNEMGEGRGRVLITTRDLNVANKAQSKPYRLHFLNLEDSKRLLYKCAFPNQQEPGGLDDVATEIANKCGGLPLALSVMGGQLYKKDKQSEWQKVADSMNRHENEGIKCVKVLETSYNDLPITTRTCFMYLASFPEDYLINAKCLIRAWVAENLVPNEETAENCLQQLAQRCLIIVRKTTNDGSIKRFCVHDLVLELAISKAEENKFVWVLAANEKHKRGVQVVSLNNARRASLQFFSESSLQSNIGKCNRKLRSLLVYGDKSNLPDDFDLSEFRLLTVLKVDGYRFITQRKLEKLCEQLIHLRHLELRNCEIENDKIPESIGQLKRLLTLDCIHTYIEEVPDSVWSITTLRHLVLTNSFYIYAPKQKKQKASASSLKTLRWVRLEPSKKYHFPQLHHLSLQYNGPWIAEDLLKNLNKNLICLQIIANSAEFNLFDDVVLDMRDYPFYQNLQILLLEGAWPEHVRFRQHLFPPHLTDLSLLSCTLKEDSMPELEQLRNLEILELSPLTSAEENITTLSCSGGGFPQLQTLRFGGFRTVQELSIAPGAMPMLKELVMTGFEGLKSNIPELQHLKMLRHFEWANAPFSSEKEIQAMREHNQHKLQHIRTLLIN